MGKIGLASVSLISAIPGGILSFLLVLAVMNHLAGMPTAMKGAAIVVLLVAALMTLFPLYLLILYRGRKVVLAKDKPSAFAPVAAAVGGGALAEEFLDDFNPSADDIMADQREEEVFGDSGQFLSSSELSTIDDYSDDQTQEFSGDLETGLEDFGAHSSAEMGTVEFSMEEDEEKPSDLSDDFLSIVDDEIGADNNGSEAELLTGGGFDDDFNFELFDDEDEKKK